MLDYTFILDTAQTFSHVYEFEKGLKQFFAQHGLDAKLIQFVDGSGQKRAMYITKKSDIIPVPKDDKKVGRPMTLKGKIERLSDRKLRKPAQEFAERRIK